MNDKPVGVYEKLLFGLFSLGAGILALVTLFILYGVIARNTGLPPFTHTLALTEYGLYYVTLLGAPWLVRKKRHVYMQLITAIVPAPIRPFISRLSYLLCIITCALICYYAGLVTIETWLRGDQEVRSGSYPADVTLFLKVSKTGAKNWVQRLTINGVRRDMGLGGWPVVLLDDAR